MARWIPWPGAELPRGIVICGGGERYLPGVWVLLQELRCLGCQLPVEVWHLGKKEMPPLWRRQFETLPGVLLVDARQVRARHPARILNGWELKPYSIIHCRFREVLLLDADNVPVRDPEYLFDLPEVREKGALFWPDYGRLAPERTIWRICDVPFRDEPEFETGQVLVDKASCWKELGLAMHLNEYSDFYYRHVHGDKETFHLAWMMLGREYAMPARGIHSLEGTMCQHDLTGERIFQHRNGCKWRLEGNARINGFRNEDRCLAHLAELAAPPAADETLLWKVANQRDYVYERKDRDQRILSLLPDGRVGNGRDRGEMAWEIQGRSLFLIGNQGYTAELEPFGECWIGEWFEFEKIPARLVPLKLPEWTETA